MSKRRLPDFDLARNVTPERNVSEQYLAKFPDQLGRLLAKLPKKARERAIQSLNPRDVMLANYSIEERMTGPTLQPNDEIVVVTFDGTSMEDTTIISLRIGMLDERITGVLELWLEAFYKMHATNDLRIGHVEPDGSAKLNVYRQLNELDEAIDLYISKHEDDPHGDEDGPHPEPEQQVEELKDFLWGFFEEAAGPAGFQNGNNISLYHSTPKITIRCDVNAND